MTRTITFNKTGYDPFIDFIKAYAIICVLIGHTLPVERLGYGLWAGMQVPLFILIQVFHYYKKDDSRYKFVKLIKRIVLPFVLFCLVQFTFLALIGGMEIKQLIINGLCSGGGYGPGSYYPIIYLQTAVLLSCFKPLFKRTKKKGIFLFFLILAESLELICSCTHPPEWLYRILAIRYVFLIYLGWVWVKDGIILNGMMIVLSILSALSIIYFEYVSVYLSINNEPWFFSTLWSFHRWPCYFFVAFGLVYLLHVAWSFLQRYTWIYSCVKILAKSSYEIFLMQMTCICIFNAITHTILVIMKIVIIWIISILGGIGVNYFIYKRNTKKPTYVQTSN